jgi:hypothetical protein
MARQNVHGNRHYDPEVFKKLFCEGQKKLAAKELAQLEEIRKYPFSPEINPVDESILSRAE